MSAFVCPCAAEEEECSYASWYAGASGGVLLPGGESGLKRAASTSVRAGHYVTEMFAVEAEAASAPHVVSRRAGGSTLTSASVGGVLHLAHFTFYDRLFGSERFDPFLSSGLHCAFASRHVFADASHRTALGPYAGIGAFYHLTDSLSLRAEARADLCCDSPCFMLYGVCAGIQYSFGEDR